MIPWISLEKTDQLDEIVRLSYKYPVVIFKHSTRCSISSMAKMRLEGQWEYNSSSLPAYYLDLLLHKELSAQIAEKFNVYHESPQLILIINGESGYDASHFDISVDELKESIKYIQSQS